MKKTTATLLVMVMLVMLVSGCVSRRDFDDLMVEYGALRARVEAAESKLAAAQDEIQALQNDLVAEKSKIEKLERDVMTVPGYTQGARVYRSSNQLIPNNTYTKVSFTNETYDTDNCFDADTPDRLTCNTAGKYIIVANIRWAGLPGGLRAIQIQKNGENIVKSKLQPNDVNTMFHVVATIIDLEVGDYIECGVLQDRGGSLNIETHGIMAPSFMMQRIG